MKKETIRIGCGAGFSGDRLEPALILAEQGQLDYLVLECLAERTIALAQKRKIKDPAAGYDILLERRIEMLLPVIVSKGIKLITNMGAANPVAAAQKIIDIAGSLNIKVRVAAVTGDDVFEKLDTQMPAMETAKPLHEHGELISANAYMGIEGILNALKDRVDIVITGRVADPSLFLAPMIHAFGWDIGDYDLLAKGTIIGHLLECAGHVSGGYFADPARKPVEGLDQLGHPFADIASDGTAVISKVEGTGGAVTVATVKEQLLYEVINPYEYLTPDISADFTSVSIEQIGDNKVRVSGGHGKKAPTTCKVSVGYRAFYAGEGEISYAGSNALERAELAGDIIMKRFANRQTTGAHTVSDLRVDLIGINSVHRKVFQHIVPPYEVRLRVVGKATTPDDAAVIGEEVEALYTNGPAGGGGVRKTVNEVIGIISVLMDRNKIEPQITILAS